MTIEKKRADAQFLEEGGRSGFSYTEFHLKPFQDQESWPVSKDSERSHQSFQLATTGIGVLKKQEELLGRSLVGPSPRQRPCLVWVSLAEDQLRHPTCIIKLTP